MMYNTSRDPSGADIVVNSASESRPKKFLCHSCQRELEVLKSGNSVNSNVVYEVMAVEVQQKSQM